MGTRNLTMVVKNKEYKIAQYGQWDGYPNGQGRSVFEFLTKTIDKEKFLQKLEECKFVSNEEIEKAYDVSRSDDKFEKIYPFINRDLGAKILELVQEYPETPLLQNQLGFAGDSLMCEWGYLIDFDKDKLEVYKGFNKSPLTSEDRFADPNLNLEITDKVWENEDKSYYSYHPIKKVAEFDINNMPTFEGFLTEISKSCPEED